MPIPTFYFTGKKFPAISVTGDFCSLLCKHCNAHFLKGMIECKQPEKLIEIARRLELKGAKGFLLSGGCDPNGKIPLERFYPALGKIKSSFALSINLHVGLLNPADVKKVVECGVDVVSAEVIGDNDTIRDVYNLKAKQEDYGTMLTSLFDGGANVVPHVTAGIHFGELRGEERALKMIEEIKPKALVLNSLLPTKNTVMEKIQYDGNKYLSVLSSARKRFPNAKILMGCMRPRDKRVEKEALKLGIDGIVLPSRETMENFRHKKLEVCCAMLH